MDVDGFVIRFVYCGFRFASVWWVDYRVGIIIFNI